MSAAGLPYRKGELLDVDVEQDGPGPLALAVCLRVVTVGAIVSVPVAHYDSPALAHQHAEQIRAALAWDWRGQ